MKYVIHYAVGGFVNRIWQQSLVCTSTNEVSLMYQAVLAMGYTAFIEVTSNEA